jgi:hypothetical protein
MKPVHLLHTAWVVSWGLCVAAARAQNAPAVTNALPPLPVLPALTNAVGSVEPAEDGTRLASPRLPRLEPPTPVPLAPTRYGGLVGQMRETDRPLQLFNPLAPPEYGDGTQNLSVNPRTGRAEGLTLFSIQLKPKSSAKKPKKHADSGR